MHISSLFKICIKREPSERRDIDLNLNLNTDSLVGLSSNITWIRCERDSRTSLTTTPTNTHTRTKSENIRWLFHTQISNRPPNQSERNILGYFTHTNQAPTQPKSENILQPFLPFMHPSHFLPFPWFVWPSHRMSHQSNKTPLNSMPPPTPTHLLSSPSSLVEEILCSITHYPPP